MNPAWPVAATSCAEAQATEVLALSRRLLRRLAWPVRANGTAASVHFYFALLYHCSMVRNVEAAAGSHEPETLFRLTVEFYRLYFESVVRRICGDAHVRRTPLWDAYFDRAEAWDRHRLWVGLPLLLDAAAHAHVEGDLAEAIVAVCDSRRSLDVIGEELFGPGGSVLYARVMADFAHEISTSTLLPPKPFAAWLFRQSSFVLCAPMVRRLQTWRRGAVEAASRALASPSANARGDLAVVEPAT